MRIESIEKFEGGEEIWARPHDNPTGPLQKCKVVRAFKNGVKETMFVKFENGLELRGTTEHPFYVKGKGWTPLGELSVGDVCFDREQKPVAVTEIIKDGKQVEVFNIEVEGCHTYYIGNDAFEILVHNECPICHDTGPCYACGGENTDKLPVQIKRERNPIYDFRDWMNGDLYGIIIYKTGFNTKAFSRHEVFQGLEGKIRGDLKDLAKNGGINLKADELIEKLKLLSDPNFSRNPMTDPGNNGEADWIEHSVHNQLPGRPIADVLQVKIAQQTSDKFPSLDDAAATIRAIVGSFRYTFQITSVDFKTRKAEVTFKAYNVMSNKSGSFRILSDTMKTKLHQFYIWSKEIDF